MANIEDLDGVRDGASIQQSAKDRQDPPTHRIQIAVVGIEAVDGLELIPSLTTFSTSRLCKGASADCATLRTNERCECERFRAKDVAVVGRAA